MDLQAHLRAMARHLVWMADMPMARKHAALRLEQLKASDPMYALLPELIRQERESYTSPAPSPESLP